MIKSAVSRQDYIRPVVGQALGIHIGELVSDSCHLFIKVSVLQYSDTEKVIDLGETLKSPSCSHQLAAEVGNKF